MSLWNAAVVAAITVYTLRTAIFLVGAALERRRYARHQREYASALPRLDDKYSDEHSGTFPPAPLFLSVFLGCDGEEPREEVVSRRLSEFRFQLVSKRKNEGGVILNCIGSIVQKTGIRFWGMKKR